MDRRTVLLGSTGALTTLLAGCVGNLQSTTSAGRSTDEAHHGNEGNQGNERGNQRDDHPGRGEGRDGPTGVPGFIPEEVELDSGNVRIEEFRRRGRILTVRLVTTVDDLTQLREELVELGPALERGIEDAEGFFSQIQEIDVTLEDESGAPLAAARLDADKLRAFADGELTAEELIDEVQQEIDRE
jgi:hypothetical protein